MLPYKRSLKTHARSLRANMTDAEQFLWQHLRRKQIHGMQFYRQKPLLGFIVDFYCPKARLVVEIDGGQHMEPERITRDRNRDGQLAEIGLHVLRFDNRQVLNEIEGVVEVIGSYCEKCLAD